MRELIDAIPCRYCLATSSSIDRATVSLDITGLLPLFDDRIFSASMVAHGKPAPDLFLHAARTMGAEPARCLVIEDSEVGVLAARNAGMTVWRFVGGSHFDGSRACPPRMPAIPVFATMAEDGGGFSRRSSIRQGQSFIDRRANVSEVLSPRSRPRKGEADGDKLDDAARAGWLYYVAGNTQDEIAQKLGVSRQTAQRLVSMAVSERLIKVRLDHPIARCMELAARLAERFALMLCEVVPTDPRRASPPWPALQRARARTSSRGCRR